jgi:chromate transport protein ChrA
VDEHGWLTRQEFVDSFVLGQLTPGPALLMVMFAGFNVAGTTGAIAAGAALLLWYWRPHPALVILGGGVIAGLAGTLQ